MMFNNGKHIVEVMERVDCKKHHAVLGNPCWTIRKGTKGSFGYYAAICNDRVSRAGFDGQISDSSMRRNGQPRTVSRIRQHFSTPMSAKKALHKPNHRFANVNK